MHNDFNRCYERNHLNFFVMYNAYMVHFVVQLDHIDEKSDSIAF